MSATEKRYVIESGLSVPNRPRDWTVVDEASDSWVAYRVMVARALLLKALYGPHGGRRLRVREVAP